MSKPILLIFLLALAACGPSIQTTSGLDYVAARGPGGPLAIDKEIAEVAAVEPHLRFPARIGVARVVNGRLSPPPSQEADLFGAFAERNAQYGAFIPVSPLVAAMVNAPSQAASPVRAIRRAAARQHLDYVLVYEIGARSRTGDTPFALADVTLIGGAFLPTRNIRIAGIGQAVLIDVRNGYPYGTTTVTADISGLARSFGTHRREAALRDKAALAVTKKLIPDVEEMLAMLGEKAR